MARKPAFIRNSMAREAQIQVRMLTKLERSFRKSASMAVMDECNRLLAHYRITGEIPQPNAEDRDRFEKLYFNMALRASTSFGSRIVTQGKAFGFEIETKEGFWARLFHDLAFDWISQEAIRRRITSVTETTRNLITRRVEEGQAAGLGVDAIASTIAKQVPGIARGRGALIARTETHGAANFASFQSAKKTGLELRKFWNATYDARTRGADDEFNHVAMDGQSRAMDEPFEMPWASNDPLLIQFPGEAGHPGGATINCRCAVVFRPVGLDD